MKKSLLMAGMACIISANANANPQIEPKPYVGLDYVYSDADLSFEDDTFFEHKFSSLSLNVGAKLHKNFGVEAFYQQSNKEKGDLVQNLITGEIGKTKTSFYGFGVDLMGYLPIYEGLEAYAGLGLGEYKVKVEFPGAKDSEDKVAPRIGGGLMYNFNEHIAARAGYRYVHLDIDGVDDMSEWTFGVRYNF